MNAAQRRHYDAIHQLARDEWPVEDDVVFEKVGTFHTLHDGTIVVDELGTAR